MRVIMFLGAIIALPFFFLKALGFMWRLLFFGMTVIVFWILFWLYEQSHVMELAQIGGGIF